MADSASYKGSRSAVAYSEFLRGPPPIFNFPNRARTRWLPLCFPGGRDARVLLWPGPSLELPAWWGTVGLPGRGTA